jgi:arginase
MTDSTAGADRPVRVIGAPTDYGADRRGVDMGPSAIRYARLAAALESAGLACEDGGDVPVPRPEGRDPDAAAPKEGHAKFLREVATVSERLATRVADALAADTTPLVLGGDHSVGIGSIAGTAREADIGVVYLDAHGDFNTPATSPSGNVHGMTLAASLGLGAFGAPDASWARAPGLSPEDVALVGLRDLDPGERELLRDCDAAAYTVSDVDERGIAAILDEALARLDAPDGLHVSVDVDVLDPTVAPGVGTPVRGGLTYREAHAALEAVAESGRVRSLELVEVNPILDEHNATAELAVELAASTLGKRIL